MAPLASTSSLKLKSSSQAGDSNSDFIHFRASMRLPIAPLWGSKGDAGGEYGSGGMEGVKEVLAGWVMRYLPPLRAVLLTFDPLPTFAHPTSYFPASSSPFPPPSRQTNHSKFMTTPGPEEDDEEVEASGTVQLKALPMIEGSGFALAMVEWQGLAWRPRIGQQIVGSSKLCTPSHISLLLHNLFNATIPSSHIPEDTWRFDPDFPVPEAIQLRQKLVWPVAAAEFSDAAEEEKEGSDEEDEEKDEEEMDVDEVKVEDEEEEQYRERGWWCHRITNEPLGGTSGRIPFTIVGLSISNSMITVTGSLLPDPFAAPAPRRAPSAPLASKKRRRANSGSSSGSESESSRSATPPARAPPRIQSGGTEEVVVPHPKIEITPAPKEKKDKSGKKERKNRTEKSEEKKKAKAKENKKGKQ